MTYHPTLGTFIERDPIGYGDGMNLYEYVGSNPVNFVDPMGLASVRTDVKLYTLVRDSAKPRATLTAKEDFSARVLANALMMSATDVDKWLLDDKGTRSQTACFAPAEPTPYPILSSSTKDNMLLWKHRFGSRDVEELGEDRGRTQGKVRVFGPEE